MEFLGHFNHRKIYYISTKEHPQWRSSLPKKDWATFTIVNEENESGVPLMVSACVDACVDYICCAGEIASLTHDYFDEEIVWRSVDNNSPKTDYSPLTTFHSSISEGFWYCCQLENDEDYSTETIVCIDLTRKKVKNLLKELIEKMKSGWLPEGN